MLEQSLKTKEADARVQELLGENLKTHYLYADQVFVYLMAGQWIFGIFIALVFSPYTWSGRVQSTHVHVYTAVFLGGLISSLPIALAFLRPGARVTRYTMAVAQMLWSALLIHLTGGRIETHFHVFGSLAFLAFYLDWPVLITATIIVAADHFLRGIYWPESVYGIANPEWWRFLEHAGWVAFCDTFLIWGSVVGRRENAAAMHKQAEIEQLTEQEQLKTAALEMAMAEMPTGWKQ